MKAFEILAFENIDILRLDSGYILTTKKTKKDKQDKKDNGATFDIPLR